MNDHVNCILLLLQEHANINAQDTDGNAPLHISCRYGHLRSCKSLLFWSTSPNSNLANQRGDTALHIAAQEGHERIVAELLHFRASPSIRNNKGQTAVQVAANASIQAWLQEYECKYEGNVSALHDGRRGSSTSLPRSLGV